MDNPPSYEDAVKETPTVVSLGHGASGEPSVDQTDSGSSTGEKATDVTILKGKTPPSFSAPDYRLELRNGEGATPGRASMIMWCPPPEVSGSTERVEYELEVRTGFDWSFLNVQELTCIPDNEIFLDLLPKEERCVEFLLRIRARYAEPCVSVQDGHSVEGSELVVSEWAEVAVRLEDRRRR